MESRFGVKDFVLISLIILLLILVGLASCGYNRQWETIKSVEKQLTEQGSTLAELSKALRRGGFSSGAESEALGYPGFERQLAVMSKPDYAEGDWLVDAFSADVDKLTPLISTDVYQQLIADYVLDTLIEIDPQTLEWLPRLAMSWEVSDDGLTYTYDLRPDAVFSDGKPLTSEDVIFTYNMIMNPDINCPRLVPYYEKVESVVAEGPHRVIFRMKEPYFQSLGVTGEFEVLAKHYYSRFTPEEFNASTGLLFGSGPYKLEGDPEDWTPGSGPVTLVRNENYWGPRPSFDKLIWYQIKDEVARLTSFRNGEIDSYLVPADRYFELKDDPNLQARGNLFEYDSLRSGYIYIAWNQERDGEPTRFADKRVRQAMSLLINRDQICNQIMSGLARPASGPFHPLGWQADLSIEPWPFDPERAKALLAEAGFKDTDNDGVLNGPDGRPFRFNLTYPSGSPVFDAVVSFVRDTCAQAGIVVNPDPLDFSIVKQRLDDRQFDAISLGWGGSVETDPKQMFHSDAIKEGGDNFMSYRNPELDALIDKARVTLDDDARRAMWHQVHRMLHEDQPYAFLFTRKAVVYIDKRIHNAIPTRTGMNPRTEMYVPEDEQHWTE